MTLTNNTGSVSPNLKFLARFSLIVGFFYFKSSKPTDILRSKGAVIKKKKKKKDQLLKNLKILRISSVNQYRLRKAQSQKECVKLFLLGLLCWSSLKT